MIKKDEYVGGPNLWRAGFAYCGLEGIRILSGLIDVIDVIWVDQNDALFFVVRDKDKTQTVFRGGMLRGDKIHRFQSNSQPLLVHRTNLTKRRNTDERTFS